MRLSSTTPAGSRKCGLAGGQLHIGQRFSSGMIQGVDLDGESFLLMDDANLFATPRLKHRLESSPFKYLRFTEGLDEFAGKTT